MATILVVLSARHFVQDLPSFFLFQNHTQALNIQDILITEHSLKHIKVIVIKLIGITYYHRNNCVILH